MGTVGCFFRRVQISQSQFREFKFRELSLPPNQIVLNTKISDDKFRECTKNTRNSQKLYSTTHLHTTLSHTRTPPTPTLPLHTFTPHIFTHIHQPYAHCHSKHTFTAHCTLSLHNTPTPIRTVSNTIHSNKHTCNFPTQPHRLFHPAAPG